MGRTQAKLLPATASEKSVEVEAGAMRHSRPRVTPTKTQPHMVRKGMKLKVLDRCDGTCCSGMECVDDVVTYNRPKKRGERESTIPKNNCSHLA